MDGTRPREPLTDSALDRELESAFGVEPSPEFLARVRTRIAGEPEPSSWRLGDVVSGFLTAGASAKAVSRTRAWVAEPLWAVAIVGIVLAVVVPGWMRDGEVPSKAVTAPIARAVEIASGEASQPAEPAFTGVVPARTQRRTAHLSESPARLSTPLFSEDDRKVFMQFVAAVETGRVPPVVEAAAEAADQSVALPELRIEPLVIDPLPLLAARVPTEGEGKW